MSYGPGRSRMVQGTLAGVGAWVVGSLLAVVTLGFFGVVDPSDLVTGVLAYSLVVVWFVLLLAIPNGGEVLSVLVPGVLSSLVLIAAGALTVARVTTVDGPWESAKVGAIVAVGHFLMVAVSFATFDWALAGAAGSMRTFALTFGGFVVPAAFGATGGVLYQQFGGQA